MNKYYDGFGREVTLELSAKDRERLTVLKENTTLESKVLELTSSLEKQSKIIKDLRLEINKQKIIIKDKEDEICQLKINVTNLTGEETPSEPPELETSQNKAKTVN